MKKYKRLIFWLGIFAVAVIAIEAKKSVIIEKKQAKALSILSEKREKGEPVDVWVLKHEVFSSQERVTLTPSSDGNSEFYTSREIKERVKKGALVRDFRTNSKMGVISDVSDRPSLQNGLFHIKVGLMKRDLWGQKKFVAASVDLETFPNSILVPINKVLVDQGKYSVWLVRDGKAEKVEIKVGQENSQFFRVTSGLSIGDELVVEGASQLRDGSNVRIRNRVNLEEIVQYSGVGK